MKYLSAIIWVLFIAIIIFNISQGIYSAVHDLSFNIVSLELADKNDGKALLDMLCHTPLGTHSALHQVIINTIIDFFFIVAYVGVLIIVSYSLMQKEPRAGINDLLRLNMLLAVIAGLLDGIENIVLLYDMHNYSASKSYYSSIIPASAKFALIIYIIIVWLISLAGRKKALQEMRKPAKAIH